MVAVVLKDGLGNQLFQYAAGRCLSYKLGAELRLDISHFKKNKFRQYSLHHFNIEEQFISREENFSLRAKNRISKLLNKSGIPIRNYRYHESGFEFNPEFLCLPDNIYIEGYWQTEKNFIDIEDIIREEFVVKAPPHGKNKFYLNEIEKVNSVAIHIRRGDYIEDADLNSIYGVCSFSYYRDAIDYIIKRVSDPRFFIFSDDMEWVKQNIFVQGGPVTYVDHNINKDYEDLRLIYSCNYQIIANSSFSWWGAWLNRNKAKIVVAPEHWFKSKYANKDLIPASWIKL